MVVIVRGTVPSSEFALRHTLEAVPNVEVEIERIVSTSEHSAMPLSWVRGGEREATATALENDPSVEDATLLADFDDEWLYRMEWVDHVKFILQMVTGADATVLDAYGSGDRWMLRAMYPDRDALSAVDEFRADHGLTFDVESVRRLDGDPSGRFGLTAGQYEALTTAAERGFFEVPRGITLQELAEELGISHQALSERIRRGTDALIDDTLLIKPPP
ncbi:helix-turn-helix domain-containing protein [Halobaculum rarum]|uniref:helix-turn-helix domain-containing protein n=1 Tax=Halobaculum rarum TaxID=3075122 RepID=UPI0032AFBC73